MEKSPNSLYAFRKLHIEAVLALTGYDEVKAADALGMSIPQLHRWEQKLDIRACTAVPELGQTVPEEPSAARPGVAPTPHSQDQRATDQNTNTKDPR